MMKRLRNSGLPVLGASIIMTMRFIKSGLPLMRVSIPAGAYI